MRRTENGCAMPQMSCVTLKFKIMGKVIYNLSLILILAVPCCLLMVDSITMQFLGLVYSIEYTRKVLIPLYKRVRPFLS